MKRWRNPKGGRLSAACGPFGWRVGRPGRRSRAAASDLAQESISERIRRWRRLLPLRGSLVPGCRPCPERAGGSSPDASPGRPETMRLRHHLVTFLYKNVKACIFPQSVYRAVGKSASIFIVKTGQRRPLPVGGGRPLVRTRRLPPGVGEKNGCCHAARCH